MLLIISIATGGFRGITGAVVADSIDADEAGGKAVDYINTNLLQPGNSAELNDVSEVKGLYAMNMTIAGQAYTSYVTKDGKMLFTTGIEIKDDVEKPAAQAQTAATPSVEKSDKPSVELFVMSQCPYAIEAEKAIIPVLKNLK